MMFFDQLKWGVKKVLNFNLVLFDSSYFWLLLTLGISIFF